jgi:hypothetical protein
LFGRTLASPIAISAPTIPDTGLVHRVKDPTENSTAVLDVCKDLNTLVCVPLHQGFDSDLKVRQQPFLVSIATSNDFDAAKLVQQLPANCIGVVLDCGYLPPAWELVDQFNGFEMPARLKVQTSTPHHPAFRFDMISKLKNATKLPLVVRGIQSAEDAR